MFEILDHPKLPFYLLISFLILLSGCIIALLLNASSNSTFTFATSSVFTMTTLQIFETIFIKNLIATFFILSISIFGIRLLPILFIGYNGYMLGTIIFLLHYNPVFIFATIFPHGYCEFSLILFTGACSFTIIHEIHKTGLNAYTLLTKHNNSHIKYILKNYLFYPYLLIIIPGVFIAAIIEATFSLWNLKILLGA